MSTPLRNQALCIDGRMFDAGQATGVAGYARMLRATQQGLTRRPLMLIDRTLGHPARPAGPRDWIAALPPGMRHAREPIDGMIVAPGIFRRAHHHFTLHRRLMRVRVPGPAGIVHWTYPLPIELVGWVNIYTVHDAIPLVRPDLTPIDPVRHRRILERIVRAAWRIVTVTAAARDDILATLGCAEDLVVDCGQPVDVAIAADAPLPQGLSPGGYLLACGSIEPRKNLAALAAAYRASGTHLPLVIAGPDGWRAETVLPALDGPGIRRLPYLDRGQLLTLIARARALLMPSLAEGFGLPVAEAMALGTPAVTSRDGALAEVAAGAALLVDPASPADMAAAIARIASDDGLAATLSAAGKLRSRAFTPAAFAARIGALYGEAVAR